MKKNKLSVTLWIKKKTIYCYSSMNSPEMSMWNSKMYQVEGLNAIYLPFLLKVLVKVYVFSS